MADQDDSEKTEEPTGKKLADARRKGNIPKSQEIDSVVSLVGLLFSLIVFFPWILPKVALFNFKFLELPHEIEVGEESLQGLFWETASELFLMIGPILFFFTFLSLVSTYAQIGRTFSWEKMKMEFSKISPISGVKRLFSPRSLVEFGKGLVKLLIVGMILIFVAIPLMADIELFPGFDLLISFERIQDIAVILVFWTVAIMSIVACLDYIFQKFDHKKKLRMSKWEVKDERKQLEGDPKVKARLAQIRQDRQRARMMAKVTKADLVITNPNHYAVALQYDMNSMPAPVLVAKDVEDLALRIREVADENEVPIVENPPLARALYAAVELDESIPEHLYHAVAEVIRYVFRLKGKLPSDGPIRPPQPDWSLDPGISDEENPAHVLH